MMNQQDAVTIILAIVIPFMKMYVSIVAINIVLGGSSYNCIKNNVATNNDTNPMGERKGKDNQPNYRKQKTKNQKSKIKHTMCKWNCFINNFNTKYSPINMF